MTLLMHQLLDHPFDFVVRLLQDPRVQSTVNVQNYLGYTALHYACYRVDEPEVPAIIQLLLQAGADLELMNKDGLTALYWLQHRHPTHPTTLALLEQSLDAEEASFLVKARRLVMAATKTTPPSYLQGRVACGLPLPVVVLAPVTDGPNSDDGEEARLEFRSMLTWLVGMEGGMPQDVFWVFRELLMPWWDPLRRKAPWSWRGGQGQSE